MPRNSALRVVALVIGVGAVAYASLRPRASEVPPSSPLPQSSPRSPSFAIRLETGPTILLDYNIDLASRITPLEIGDTVVARGRYVWNEQGGRMHWLHHDPSGAPGGGWVRVQGRVYQ